MVIKIKGKDLLIDEDIYIALGKPKVYISDSGNGKLYRLVMDAPSGMTVDHINGNTLDNRLCNLRLATHRQNLCNQLLKNKRDLPRGVFRKSGRYECPLIAHKAYLDARLKYMGDFHKVGG